MITPFFTLLPNDKTHAIRADLGSTTKPTLVTDKVTHVAIAPILSTMSTDSNFDVRVS